MPFPVSHLSEEEFKTLCQEDIDSAWEQYRELQRRLGLHSQNSSKPPSTDLSKKKRNNSRESASDKNSCKVSEGFNVNTDKNQKEPKKKKLRVADI